MINILGKKFKLSPQAPASTLLVTLLLLFGAMIIVMAIGSLVLNSIKMREIELRSAQAYYAAEAGQEKMRWLAIQPGFACPSEDQTDIYADTLANGSSYSVDYNLAAISYNITGQSRNVSQKISLVCSE